MANEKQQQAPVSKEVVEGEKKTVDFGKAVLGLDAAMTVEKIGQIDPTPDQFLCDLARSVLDGHRQMPDARIDLHNWLKAFPTEQFATKVVELRMKAQRLRLIVEALDQELQGIVADRQV